MNPPAMTSRNYPFRRFLFAPLLAAGLALSACGGGAPQQAQAEWPLAGASIGGDFTLVNKDGETVKDLAVEVQDFTLPARSDASGEGQSKSNFDF